MTREEYNLEIGRLRITILKRELQLSKSKERAEQARKDYEEEKASVDWWKSQVEQLEAKLTEKFKQGS